MHRDLIISRRRDSLCMLRRLIRHREMMSPIKGRICHRLSGSVTLFTNDVLVISLVRVECSPRPKVRTTKPPAVTGLLVASQFIPIPRLEGLCSISLVVLLGEYRFHRLVVLRDSSLSRESAMVDGVSSVPSLIAFTSMCPELSTLLKAIIQYRCCVEWSAFSRRVIDKVRSVHCRM